MRHVITTGPPREGRTTPGGESTRGDSDAGAGAAPPLIERDWILVPVPREIQVTGVCRGVVPGPVSFQREGVAGTPPMPIRREYDEVLPDAFLVGEPPSRYSSGMHADAWGTTQHYPATTLAIDPGTMPHPQGYRLEIAEERIRVVAHDEPGLFYAAQTLKQLARQIPARGAVPQIRVTDWPDFLHRGISHDVARDKVPTMATLYGLADKMAEWKLNQLQLYTEHTFAYSGHHVVWEDASPITPDQIRALDAYCRERYIELVPNQNSFGHMGRWLEHEEYQHLAEMPGGGSDLCPVDPASIEFLRGLYDDMLPAFSSGMANVGCDETWSLGKGRSKDAVEARGVGRVYLEFLLKIHELVQAHGKRVQFWGDIVMKHPELIPELPKDMIALEWGYEATHPFAEHGKRFAEAGIPFYVAPGTSSWNSLVGRTSNAMANLRNAAANGRENGAVGYLITDWGDNGHWQFLPVSYAPFVYGAAVSWSVEANTEIDVPRALDVHVFEDSAGVMGRLACDLGDAYTRTGVIPGNNTAFYALLLYHTEGRMQDTWLKAATAERLEETIACVDAVMARLGESRMTCPDAELTRQEFALAGDLVRFACRLGIARRNAGGVGTSELPDEAKRALAAELEPLVPRFRRLWLARNRSGGLTDSAGRFENLLAALASE